ncbi:MAG TPA: hypothetical protein ENH88_22040 [Pseudoalteromonas prydzensis]|uniref:Uncharacterized protein n=1 Tax=Pseudoalteromonas prydzensis TaxID=182141 RepID=A0A7V1D377_9GAMM|nr:hypothetical protein [Pseudoalteromonas prydzensis]HEA19078.1 hypothetical protein [Pseudoalteromonas prydzensis]
MFFKELTINGVNFVNVPADPNILLEMGISEAEVATMLDTLTKESGRLEVLSERLAAYKAESDPLYMEAQFDGTPESLQKWRDKVTEIKVRYPLPDNA